MAKVEFNGSQGDKLAARMDMPEDESNIKAFVLFAHCFTCNKDIFAASRISKQLNNHGVAVLRFDFTGLGASDGDFSNTNFTSNVEDLVSAAEFMKDEFAAPSLMIGHSLGGAATILAAHKISSTKAIATLAAPADAKHVQHHFQDSKDEILKKGSAEVMLVGRPFTIQKQFIDDIESHNMDKAVSTLKKPILVMHAPLDQTVGIENAEHIFKTAKHPRSYVSLDDSDHLISKKEHAIYAADVIYAWASRYLSYNT